MHARPVLPTRIRVVTPAVALMTGLTLALAGCGSSTGGVGGATPAAAVTAVPLANAPAAPADATTIAITLKNGTVDPSGTGVAVKVNQPVVLRINADKAGELHVHSTPEQHIEFPVGESTVTLKLAQPGVVDVEDHSLDKLIVQLKVS